TRCRSSQRLTRWKNRLKACATSDAWPSVSPLIWYSFALTRVGAGFCRTCFERCRRFSMAANTFGPHCSSAMAPRRVVRNRTSRRSMSSILATAETKCYPPALLRRYAEHGFERSTQGVQRWLDAQSLARLLSLGAVSHHVLGILQLIAGQHGDHVSVALDLAVAAEFSHPGDCGGGGGLATNAVFRQDRLGFEDFLVGDRFAESPSPLEHAASLFPVGGAADADGRGFGVRAVDRDQLGQAAGEHAVKRVCALGLDHDHARHLLDESHLFELP